MMARGEGSYNGWANYETWNVALWISNDEGLYRLARECKTYPELMEKLREAGMTETPDEVAFNDSGLDRAALDELLGQGER